MTVEPGNEDLAHRKEEVDKMRLQGLPTVPTTIGAELKTNPFLRPDSANIRSTLELNCDMSDELAFAAIRKHKDSF